MNRRELIQTMAGAGAASAVRMWPAGSGPRQRHGLLTVDSHLAHARLTGESLHVYVHGKDVTPLAFEADDVKGYVLLYCRDKEHHRDLTARGALHIGGDGGACRMRVESDTVMIVPGPALS